MENKNTTYATLGFQSEIITLDEFRLVAKDWYESKVSNWKNKVTKKTVEYHYENNRDIADLEYIKGVLEERYPDTFGVKVNSKEDITSYQIYNPEYVWTVMYSNEIAAESIVMAFRCKEDAQRFFLFNKGMSMKEVSECSFFEIHKDTDTSFCCTMNDENDIRIVIERKDLDNATNFYNE